MRVFAAMIVFIIASFGSAVFAAENHVSAVPPSAEILRFPIIAGDAIPKTVKHEYELETKLGLRPVALRAPILALNHYRADNSWRHEEIQKGAIVFVDATGIVRYKADCWNRLVVERSWLDELFTWLGHIFSRIMEVLSGWGVVLSFVLGLVLGAAWGRERTNARVQNPGNHPPPQ